MKYQEKQDELDAVAKALCSIALGDFDSAFDYLDKAYEMKHPLLVFFKVFRHFDPIRDDARYKAFEAKMNFPKELLN
jgi:hypothetical protein